MKITIATPLYPPELSSAALYSKKIAKELSVNHDVTVVAFANALEKDDHISFVTIKKSLPLPLRTIRYTYSLFKVTKTSDILYVQEVLASGIPALIVSVLRNIPLVLHLAQDEVSNRNEKESNKNFLNLFLQKLVLSRASRIITPSQYFAQTISQTYAIPQDKFVTIYTPPKNHYIFPFSTEKKEGSIIVIAELLTAEHLKNIVSIISKIRNQFKNITLTISGHHQDEPSLKNTIKSLGCEDIVRFIGKASQAEEWYLHQTHSLCIVGSENKNCSYHMIENLSALTPTIAEDLPCYREFITNKKTGLLISLDDTEALENALIEFLTDKKLIESMETYTKELMKKTFSWEGHAKSLVATFSQLIK